MSDTKRIEVSLSSASLPTNVPTAFTKSEAEAIFKVIPRSVRTADVGWFDIFFLISNYVPLSHQWNP